MLIKIFILEKRNKNGNTIGKFFVPKFVNILLNYFFVL